MTTPPTRDQIPELLLAGARSDGWLPSQAAIHLLVFTELPGASAFGPHVIVEDRYSLGAMHRGAWVRDWNALLADENLYLTGTEHRFLQIAASFASGTTISLSKEVSSELGWAHARRLAEAVLIATGTAELLSISDTPKLTEMKVFHESLSPGKR